MIRGFKIPKDNDRYEWTRHVVEKMMYYRMGEGLVKRVVRAPMRREDGVAEGTVAVMKPTQASHRQEYWVMYKILGPEKKRIISAWRYPGVSPVGARIPIPDEILRELEDMDF